MTTATQASTQTTSNETKNYYDIRAYIPKGEWNKETVFIKDQIGNFRSMWVPRSEIKAATFLSKRNFKGEVDFIYTLEIETEWWHKNVNFKNQEFTGNNGHRRGHRSDD